MFSGPAHLKCKCERERSPGPYGEALQRILAEQALDVPVVRLHAQGRVGHRAEDEDHGQESREERRGDVDVGHRAAFGTARRPERALRRTGPTSSTRWERQMSSVLRPSPVRYRMALGDVVKVHSAESRGSRGV